MNIKTQEKVSEKEQVSFPDPHTRCYLPLASIWGRFLSSFLTLSYIFTFLLHWQHNGQSGIHTQTYIYIFIDVVQKNYVFVCYQLPKNRPDQTFIHTDSTNCFHPGSEDLVVWVGHVDEEVFFFVVFFFVVGCLSWLFFIVLLGSWLLSHEPLLRSPSDFIAYIKLTLIIHAPDFERP